MAHILHVASLFLLLTKLSLGQREVMVQKGPLFRAEGYPVSIGCNVTGHQGPSEQHFRWSVYLPTAPTQEIQIISTEGATFTYARYAQRVQNKGIYVKRVRGNSALLHISKVQLKDSGEYECHTPNTDGKYYGTYSAKTRLIVIPDTLSATMSSQTLLKEEGESLELTCEASKATTQHTHLSVTWYLIQDGEGSQATEIISLSKDFVLIPGPSFTKRFTAGEVQLHKLGVTTFRLAMGSLQPSDQGQLFCEATEWIQDPDETWTLITRKQTDQTTLRIQPAVRDFQVNITAQGPVTAGNSVELVCRVIGSGRDPQLRGVWLFNGNEMAHIDAGGVLDLKRDYRERASQGQLQVSKLNPKAFSLKIFSVGPEDEGTYRCAMEEVVRTRMGPWQVLQRKESLDSRVHLRKPAARNVALSTKSKQQAVWEGEALTLLCKADGAKGPLSVEWWHIPWGQMQPELVASMGQDGTGQLGASYKELNNHGNIRLEKMDWATFQLEINPTAIMDSGTYECRVSESPQNRARDRSWAQKLTVTVKSLESSLQVKLMTRHPQVTLTNTFSLSCIVEADFSHLTVPLTVTWQFQPVRSQVFHLLVRIARNGTIEWGDFLSQFQKKTKVSQSSFYSQLLIHDATEEEAGVYQCQVEVYARSYPDVSGPARASATSHPLMIVITLPGSKVRASEVYWTENATEHTEAAIHCSVESSGSPASLLSVMWFRNREHSGRNMLLHLRHNGLLEYGDEGLREHVYCYRASPTDFVLKLHRVEMEDSGMYWCKVTEWQPHGSQGMWVSQASDESQHVVFTVLPSEPTFPSRICSSTPLLYFLFTYPCILFILLLISLFSLYHKARELSALRLNVQKEKALWVDLKGTGDWRATWKEEEDN
ncbi:immunoglobulin superfamily member 2 isoform X2 [Suricata suricatta]|uniref:immunoglobulin superfamily member 2 isoform X2 n=1 Tax=Suricata suricatta TaxID=37032 RepID=UPI0011558130|nr:immunoglobulin superfamily member 2 isoform X2 [Suricata suricatta]